MSSDTFGSLGRRSLRVNEVRGQRSQISLHPFPWLHLREEALAQAEALIQSQRDGLLLRFDLLPGLQHLLVRLLREQSGGLLERLQVVVTVQQLILVQLLLQRMRMRLRHVQLPHAARAIHGRHAELHVTVGLEVVVQVRVAASAPPPQPPLLPPLHGHLHLAAQGAQRRVDVQILEGATVAAEDVVEHRRQVEVAPQDVGPVRLRRHQRGLGRPRRLAAVLRRVLPLLADFLVRAAILCAVVTLNQFALSVGATATAATAATATAASAAVVVGRNPPAFEDAVDEHVRVLRINLPEASFPRLVLLSRDLLETLVERQVVTDRVLGKKKKEKKGGGGGRRRRRKKDI